MKFPLPRSVAPALLALLSLASPLSAAEASGTQTKAQYDASVTRRYALKYLLHLPRDYATKPDQRWPLILFLHGAGERGTDVQLVAKHGPPKLIAAGQDIPAVVVSPQCPANQRWDDDALLAGPRGEHLKKMPIRVFHGAKDNVVPLAESQRLVDALRKGGYPTVDLTVYPEAGHDSWSETYANPEFFRWILAQTREGR